VAKRGAVLRGAASIPSAPGGARPTPAPQGSIPYNGGRGQNAPSIGQFSPLAAQLANEGGYARSYGPFLPRPTESFTAGAFGPFSPILPVPVDSPPPEFERPEPRRWEYTVGWNLPTGQPGNEGLRLTNFETMRRLADIYSVARACIEYRKNQIRGVQWDIVPTPAAAKAYQGSPAQMADFGKRQAKATKFFNRPDPNYFSYSLWLSAVLEDIYVYDALSILIRPVWGKRQGKGVLGSDLDSLMLLTGSTIRPLVDLHGGIPRPPAVGYQQYLYGVPRSDYMTMIMNRDIEEANMSGQDVAQFRGDQLLYLPMVPRAWTPYGFSAIERAIIPIMTGLQKQSYQYDFFEEGTVPAAYIIPGDTAMTPNQLRELQDALNAIAGDPAWKQKLIVLPPGSHVEPQRPVVTADELDQLVMSQVTMAFGVTPLELGLSPGRSSSTSSGAANQMSKMTQNNSQDVNITPMLQFLQDIFNGILEHVCGQTDMMFTFEGLQQEEDMDALTGVLVQQFQNGMRTLDECRQELNLQPYGLEESSEPLIVTPTGPTPLSTAVANAQNAAAQSAAQAQQTQAQAGQTQAQTGATQANTAATQARTQISQESHEVRMNEPTVPPGMPGGAKPQPTGAAGAEGKAEAAQNQNAAQSGKPTPAHNAAQAANSEAASTKKSAASVVINKVGPKGYIHGWVHEGPAVDAKPVFYHGTTKHFSPGDLISPASQVPGSERTGSHDESSPNHVYLTRDPGRAAEYAGMRDDPEPESPKDDRYSVYQVEPTGQFERDSQHATASNGYDVEPNYRSAAPVKVIRRMPYSHQQIASAAINPWDDDDPRLNQEISHPLYAGNLAQKRADAELEALTRHLTKGRHVTTWEARYISESLLANVAKAMAEGLDPRNAVNLAKARASDVVLAKSDYQWQDSQPVDIVEDVAKTGAAPFRGVETADVLKVGPDGYIHGFICVRPPCGEKPDKIKASDLQVKRNGTIMHKPSGYQVGSIVHDNGKYVITHSDGHVSSHAGRDNALGTLAGHYNSGKTRHDFSEQSPYAQVHAAIPNGTPRTSATAVPGAKVTGELRAFLNQPLSGRAGKVKKADAPTLKASVAAALAKDMKDFSTADLLKISSNRTTIDPGVNPDVAEHPDDYVMAYAGPVSVKKIKAQANAIRAVAAKITDRQSLEAMTKLTPGFPGYRGFTEKNLPEFKDDGGVEAAKAALMKKADQIGHGADLPPVTENDLKKIRDNAFRSIIARWAMSSNDNDILSLATQRAVTDELRLSNVADWAKESGDVADQVNDVYVKNEKALRAMVRSQYNRTQADLKAAGITHVTVYRGMHVTGDTAPWAFGDDGKAMKAGDEVSAPKWRPISSWSGAATVANEFAYTDEMRTSGETGLVLKTTVPAELVFSTPRTGFGCLLEEEWVIMAAPGSVGVDSSRKVTAVT